MKASKIILPMILIAALCLSWFSFLSGTISTYADYRVCIGEAEKSIEAGLYEQGIEYYKKSLEFKLSEGTYKKIKEIYDKLYYEEHTAFIRNLYLEDMAVASEAFPKNALFWEEQIKLNIDALNYSKAYTTVKQALNFGASSKTLDKLYNQLLYMVRTDYKLYTDYKTALNGYISVFDGNVWTVIDETGEAITSQYKFIGLINDDGKGLYTNSIDTRILDSKEITRARFNIVVEDAGYYNENSDLLPVKIDGKWKYMNSKGSFVGNEYEIAGSFYNNEAVAYTGKKWILIDNTGKETELKGIEDIKLDLYGCHIQNGVVIAKESGKYYFYDENFKKKGDFSADDIDICIDGKTVAFKKGDKWGFVEVSGKIIIEPQYTNARSFANGYAAVCSENNLWEFLNDEHKLCIDYTYKDALYFNSNETCLVSTTENTVQLFHFMFE